MSKSTHSYPAILRAVRFYGGIKELSDVIKVEPRRIKFFINGRSEMGPFEAINIENRTNGLIRREDLLESIFDRAWQQRNPLEASHV